MIEKSKRKNLLNTKDSVTILDTLPSIRVKAETLERTIRKGGD